VALKVSEDGRVFKNGVEVFELTIYEQDEVIKLLYPNDKKLLSVTEQRKKQTSWSGTHAFDLDRFEKLSQPYVDNGNCEMSERVYKWGGTRLLTLYCHKFNFEGAAMDLGLKYGALRKWFDRWRAQHLAMGLTPEALFRDPNEVINP
jgi:hypothetical protein